jgi:hypothetical protein
VNGTHPYDWDHDNNAGHGGAYDSQFDDRHDDPPKMSTWAGQPRVEGSSETVRMVLLTCVSIGITSVHVHCVGMRHAIADLVVPAASLGALK